MLKKVLAFSGLMFLASSIEAMEGLRIPSHVKIEIIKKRVKQADSLQNAAKNIEQLQEKNQEWNELITSNGPLLIKLLTDKVKNPNKDLFVFAQTKGEVGNYIAKIIIKALREAGALIDTKNEHGYTALMLASAGGHLDIVKGLLEAGAQVNLRNESIGGNTALIRASVGDHPEVVRELLAAGAQVDIKNKEGQTALNLATNDQIKDILKEALQKQQKNKS